MSDGSHDRGPKPPRTLFSLGRPGASPAPATEVEPEEPVTAAEPLDADPGAGYDAGGAGDDLVGDDADVEYELLCGACEAPLIDGAAFCGECGTPVAVEGVDYVEGIEEVEDPAYAEDAAYVEEPEGGAGYADDAAYADEPVDAGVGSVEAASTVEEPAVDAGRFGPEVGPGAEHEVETGYDVGGPAPAAVLYADPDQPEPLPPEPEGSWGIADPVFGGTDAAEDAGEATDADDHSGAGAWVGAGAAAAGGAIIGSELAADHAAAEDLSPAADTDAAEPPTAEQPASSWVDQSGAPLGGAALGAAAGWEVAAEPAGAAPLDLDAVSPAGATASVLPGAAGTTTASAMPYGSGAVESSAGGSKTGLFIGLGAAAAVVLVIGAIILLGSGGKGGDVQTAQQATTTQPKAATGPADTKKPGDASTTTASKPAETTTLPATDTTATTTAPTTASTAVTVAPTLPPVVPTTPAPTAPPTQPPVQPAYIVPSVPNGGVLSLPTKGGQNFVELTNTGGKTGTCSLTASGGASIVSGCEQGVPPGATIRVVVTSSVEGKSGRLFGGLEGQPGLYSITIDVPNG